MDSAHTGHELSLHDYFRVLAQRKWIVAIPLVLIPLAAVLLSLRQERLYEASSSVFLNRQNLGAAFASVPDYAALQDPQQFAQRQVVLAEAPDVVARVRRAAGLAPGTSLPGSTEVTSSDSGDLVFFKVTEPSQALAIRLANVYAREYTAYRQQVDTAAIQSAVVKLRHRAAALKGATGASRSLYRDTLDKLEQLQTLAALQSSNVRVYRLAVNAAQVNPRPLRNGAIGLGLGLFFGIGLAFLWNALDTRVRSADEISERLGLPLLARIPEPPRRLRRSNQLATLVDPTSVDAEAFRMLRTNLEFVNLERGARSIMFTSAVEGEGKTTTVASLALTLARAGRRVTLVDLDLRRPALHTAFRLDGHAGLTDVALGHVPLGEALARVAVVGAEAGEWTANGGTRRTGGALDVLVAGPIPPDPGEFVATHTLVGILAELREFADIVLIDAPPLLHVGDALALSAQVDALVLVTRPNLVRRPILGELHRVLGTSPAAKLGFVLTGAGLDESYGGYYYAGYRSTVREHVS